MCTDGYPSCALCCFEFRFSYDNYHAYTMLMRHWQQRVIDMLFDYRVNFVDPHLTDASIRPTASYVFAPRKSTSYIVFNLLESCITFVSPLIKSNSKQASGSFAK